MSTPEPADDVDFDALEMEVARQVGDEADANLRLRWLIQDS